MSDNKIKVLIVDDSAVMRLALDEVLSSDPEICVIGTATDPFDAADKMRHITPDVILLDINMPRMDGLTFLRKIMVQHPIPIVICSGVADTSHDTALLALEYGAVEICPKPRGEKTFREKSRARICQAVKDAAAVDIANIVKTSKKMPSRHPDVASTSPSRKIVVVGASMGGVDAIQTFLKSMPSDAPGIAIVLHLQENFTKSYAERLNAICRITVKEAENNDVLIPGRAVIAPGNRQMFLRSFGTQYYVEVKDRPPVNGLRPSVDVLFSSTAHCAGRNTIGVILTGMGADGAAGMLELKKAGAVTIAQGEKSCAVFGMPRKAIELGAVDHVLPLDRIAEAVMNACLGKASSYSPGPQCTVR